MAKLIQHVHGMGAGRGSLPGQRALLLIVGALVGYVSFENLDIWGAGFGTIWDNLGADGTDPYF